MINKRQVVKNVGSSWFGLGVNVLVGIFLSPFILHRLGDAAFGIWVLIFSITGYYGLFDMGIRSSIIRYVSKFTAVNDHEELAKLINTALFIYTSIGLAALAITALGSLSVNHIFRIPADFENSARWLFFMVGTSLAVGFPVGVFSGMLEGLERFYVLSLTNVVSTLLRATLIVIALYRGGGLLTVAFITVALPLLTAVLRGAIALRILPIPFAWRYVNRKTLREMASYGGLTFMSIVAVRLRGRTDAMVIGTFLSSVAITYFSIGARLIDYTAEVVSSLAQIFVPMSSQSEATGNIDRLRRIFVAGNRACALIVFPISATLIILGKSIIEAWVGARYIERSYPVLLVLIVPWTVMLAQGASSRVLYGMGKHGKLAAVALTEGIANLVLSILLVRPFGIMGDAFGTAIPMMATSVGFLPWHVCHLLRIRLRTFLVKAYLLPLGLCIPFVTVLLALRYWFPAHGYFRLGIQLLVAGAVYGVSLFSAYQTKAILHIGDLAPLEEERPALIPALVENYQEDI
jgi:O-antigen/teichoic acid export membrane protein